jgi:hypothetical protein
MSLLAHPIGFVLLVTIVPRFAMASSIALGDLLFQRSPLLLWSQWNFISQVTKHFKRAGVPTVLQLLGQDQLNLFGHR